jgi:hypothetical protein
MLEQTGYTHKLDRRSGRRPLPLPKIDDLCCASSAFDQRQNKLPWLNTKRHKPMMEVESFRLLALGINDQSKNRDLRP